MTATRNQAARKPAPALSAKQEDVVGLMRQGWELGVSSSINRRGAWLQKDGVGKGGPTVTVSLATVRALREKGWVILTQPGYPTSTFRLADGPRPSASR
jgi:hypothetical protein